MPGRSSCLEKSVDKNPKNGRMNEMDPGKKWNVKARRDRQSLVKQRRCGAMMVVSRYVEITAAATCKKAAQYISLACAVEAGFRGDLRAG